jgi:hypothetical protein
VLAEALGTPLLLAVVIKSGILAEGLSGGNVAIAPRANALATVAVHPAPPSPPAVARRAVRSCRRAARGLVRRPSSR